MEKAKIHQILFQYTIYFTRILSFINDVSIAKSKINYVVLGIS